MARAKSNKTEDKEIKEEIQSAVALVEMTKEDIIKKRNGLINDLRGLLTTKREMWQGGRLVRSKVFQENAYQPIVDEINELGRMVDEAPIQMGQLRRE